MKKSVFFIFTAIGLVLLGISLIVFFRAKEFVATALRAEGQVIRLVPKTDDDGTTYAPEVEFTPKNSEPIVFVSNYSTNPPSYEVNEKVTVLYVEDDPYGAKLEGFASNYLGSIMLALFGVIFSAVGIIPFLVMRANEKKAIELKQHGIQIEAKVTAIEIDLKYTYNNKHPWKISATGRAPGMTEPVTYKSQNLWSDPTALVKVGDTVSVYIDPARPNRYYLDTGFLQNLQS